MFNVETVKKKGVKPVSSWFISLKVRIITFDNKPLSTILTLQSQLLVTAPEFCL